MVGNSAVSDTGQKAAGYYTDMNDSEIRAAMMAAGLAHERRAATGARQRRRRPAGAACHVGAIHARRRAGDHAPPRGRRRQALR
jgi:hypothetical protein